MTATTGAIPSFSASAVLATGELRYSTVWEDHLLLELGLAPRSGDDLLVIASAGDNVLNLLLREPRRIVAIDVNPAQSALVELQLAAIALLDHGDFVQLLGHAPGGLDVRVALYERVRGRLGEAARGWWDRNISVIGAGIAGSGRLDRYIAGFREMHLGGADDVINRLLSSSDLDEQRMHASALFTPAFARAFTDYFSADNLGTRGRDPSQMRFVDGDMNVPAQLLSRLERACTDLPVGGNCYLDRFFRDRPATLPPYLHRANFERLRGLVSRVEIVTAEVGAYLATCAPGSLSHAALSDLFEYLSEDATAGLVDQFVRVLRVGGRMAYWNLFVPRAGATTTRRLRWLESLSKQLRAGDRVWFYRAFRVEEVVA